jgi:hypothetical protein
MPFEHQYRPISFQLEHNVFAFSFGTVQKLSLGCLYCCFNGTTEDGILCKETSMKHTLRKYCKLTLCGQRNIFITVKDLSLFEIEHTWRVSRCSVLI